MSTLTVRYGDAEGHYVSRDEWSDTYLSVHDEEQAYAQGVRWDWSDPDGAGIRYWRLCASGSDHMVTAQEARAARSAEGQAATPQQVIAAAKREPTAGTTVWGPDEPHCFTEEPWVLVHPDDLLRALSVELDGEPVLVRAPDDMDPAFPYTGLTWAEDVMTDAPTPEGLDEE